MSLEDIIDRVRLNPKNNSRRFEETSLVGSLAYLMVWVTPLIGDYMIFRSIKNSITSTSDKVKSSLIQYGLKYTLLGYTAAAFFR